ncbi:MAG: hypothetical protein A3H35_11895 [Betaproteobacteria bacterium RIFCSPLOWO2_02_FULL_62_17]|nr:MAG: hypothetical protein A3H35_11895 [Betaproteobacteria bacterium RIFCSPLOWO2_02_FULL_62_17]
MRRNFVTEPFYNTRDRVGSWAPTRVISYSGSRNALGRILQEVSQIILVTDEVFQEDEFVLALMAKFKARIMASLNIEREPRLLDVEKATIGIASPHDLVIAIGGGSAIDYAKVLSLKLSNIAIPPDENTRTGIQPIIAVPTTCGTGSETSRHAVIYDHRGKKFAIRHWDLSPAVAILDTYFLQTAPTYLIVKTAFDAFVHHLETFSLKCEANRFTRYIAVYWMNTILQAVERFITHGYSEGCIANLQLGSAYGGVSLSNSRTGLIHTLGESIASQIPVTHPDSLFLFFEPVFSTYGDWFDAEIRAMGVTSFTSHEIICKWQDNFARCAANAQAVDCSLVNRYELVTAVCSDTVIFREHPVRLDGETVTRIVDSALKY